MATPTSRSLLRLLPFCVGAALLAVACTIVSVTHPETVATGDTFEATLQLKNDTTETGSATHQVCVGLHDPDGRGWDAAPIAWQMDGQDPETGTADEAGGVDLDATRPEQAPWRCFSASVMSLSAGVEGSAMVAVTAPRCAASGSHALTWTYRAGTYSDETSTAIEVIEPAPSVVGLEDEPPGEECPLGGQRVLTGCDADDDGAPDFDVTIVGYICNGETLHEVEEEPPGEQCPHGGFKIVIGKDDGRGEGIPANGVLEEDEISSTEYVCHGAPGERGPAGDSVTVGVEPLPRGDRCPLGGHEILVGLDDGSGGGIAGNGALEPGEVQSRTTLCAQVPDEGDDDVEGGGCGAAPGAPSGAGLALLGGLLALMARGREGKRTYKQRAGLRR